MIEIVGSATVNAGELPEAAANFLIVDFSQNSNRLRPQSESFFFFPSQHGTISQVPQRNDWLSPTITK